MSFFTQPVGKRTRSQRLLYFQECVKNASKAHGASETHGSETTLMDLVTSSDESQDCHISSKESDEVKHITIKSEEHANETPGSAMGTHTYFISSSDDSDKDEDSSIMQFLRDTVDFSDHGKNSNQFPASDKKTKAFSRSAEVKGRSQRQRGGNQSQTIASHNQVGAGQMRGVGVTQTSSVRWTRTKIAQARGITTVCVLRRKVYKRFTHGMYVRAPADYKR